jgi:hypothetical protein
MIEAIREMPGRIAVLDDGGELSFTFEEMLKYHGGGSPGR